MHNKTHVERLLAARVVADRAMLQIMGVVETLSYSRRGSMLRFLGITLLAVLIGVAAAACGSTTEASSSNIRSSSTSQQTYSAAYVQRCLVTYYGARTQRLSYWIHTQPDALDVAKFQYNSGNVLGTSAWATVAIRPSPRAANRTEKDFAVLVKRGARGGETARFGNVVVAYPYKPSHDAKQTVMGCLRWSTAKREAPVQPDITGNVQKFLDGSHWGTVRSCVTTVRVWRCRVVISAREAKEAYIPRNRRVYHVLVTHENGVATGIIPAG